MAETKSSDLVVPYNPLLDHRRKGFLLNPREDCMIFTHTDLWRFNETPSSGDSTVVVTSSPHEARPSTDDAWEWKQEGNTLYIVSDAGDLVSSPEDQNVVLEGTSGFCKACYGALDHLVSHLKESREYEKARTSNQVVKSKMSVVHHWNMMSLFLAQGKDCHLCKILWSRCFDDIDWAKGKARTEMFWTSAEESVWDKLNPGDARLTCALYAANGLPVHEKTYLNIFRLQLWPSPDFDRYFGHIQTAPNLLEPLPAEVDKSSTRACRPLAVEWLARCRSNADGKHDACNLTPEKSWRPSRLLDLSDLEATRKIRLVYQGTKLDNSDERLEYITLSHCRGDRGTEELEQLTTWKLDRWQTDGIAVDSLPPTLRDAAEIVRWFGVKWLWVDCLCIVQDSQEDREHEAALMSNVYKYALLNVAATDSADARGGCFKERESLGLQPFNINMPSLDSTWWAAVDERSMFDWVLKAPLSKEAWAYQQRQLSRRVLHFTKNEVFFECCAASPAFVSETYPNGSPLMRDFVGQSKVRLPRSVGSTISQNLTLSKTWDRVCEEFSMREVSKPQDKLPALAGLAGEFGNGLPSDTYLAGLWSSTLSHSLLWSVRDGEDRPGRHNQPAPQTSKDYIAPTWSWMSIDADIIMPQRHNHHSLINILETSYHPSTADPYGRINPSSLTLRALVRRITIKTNPSPFTGKAYDLYAGLGVEKSVNLFVDRPITPEDAIGFRVANVQEFVESEDRKNLPDVREYHCMLVAVSQANKGAPRELHGLLLEPVVGADTRFRRVGVISMDGMCALKMRYKRDTTDGNSQRSNEQFRKLWGDVIPAWGTAIGQNEVTAEVSPEHDGPMSLYQFDAAGGECMAFERLEPVEITLV